MQIATFEHTASACEGEMLESKGGIDGIDSVHEAI